MEHADVMLSTTMVNKFRRLPPITFKGRTSRTHNDSRPNDRRIDYILIHRKPNNLEYMLLRSAHSVRPQPLFIQTTILYT